MVLQIRFFFFLNHVYFLRYKAGKNFCGIFVHFVDTKQAYTLGHSTPV